MSEDHLPFVSTQSPSFSLPTALRERIFLWSHDKEKIAQLTQEYAARLQQHLRTFGPSRCVLTVTLKGFSLEFDSFIAHLEVLAR